MGNFSKILAAVAVFGLFLAVQYMSNGKKENDTDRINRLVSSVEDRRRNEAADAKRRKEDAESQRAIPSVRTPETTAQSPVNAEDDAERVCYNANLNLSFSKEGIAYRAIDAYLLSKETLRGGENSYRMQFMVKGKRLTVDAYMQAQTYCDIVKSNNGWEYVVNFY